MGDGMERSPSLTVDRPSLCETPVMVVLQAREYWHIPTVVEVLVEAGLPCVEITASTPGALATIGAIHKYCCDDIDIGMGAVLRTEQVRAAAEAGAGFRSLSEYRPGRRRLRSRTGSRLLSGSVHRDRDSDRR